MEREIRQVSASRLPARNDKFKQMFAQRQLRQIRDAAAIGISLIGESIGISVFLINFT